MKYHLSLKCKRMCDFSNTPRKSMRHVFWEKGGKAVKVLFDYDGVENTTFCVMFNTAEFPQGCSSSKTYLSLLCIIINYTNTIM